MNKIISTKNEFLFCWLDRVDLGNRILYLNGSKIGTFKLKTLDKCKEKILNLSKELTFELIENLPINGTKNCYHLMTHVKKFQFLSSLQNLLLVEDTRD